MSSTADAPEATEEDEVVETDERREALVAEVRSELGDALVDSHIIPGRDIWLRVAREHWVDVGMFVRDGLGCAFFNFLSAIDWMPSPYGREHTAEVDDEADGGEDPEPMEQGVAGGETRFQLLARVHNVVDHTGITLKTDLDDTAPSIDSWIPVYSGANWHERETWEMYGIDFVGHPNLVHLYLPHDFEGNPLRKDYPLLARRVKPWPGIVDVEQMPDEGEGDDGDGSADEEADR